MASSSSSSHFAPTSSSQLCEHDVFLSFRGEDTRKTFVDHLYTALKKQLIHTYKDDETLPRGESIGPSLFKAIEESHIVVIIFSTRYADSSWCLEELAHVMKCKNERGLNVMPVFYDVEPSDVRKQTGNFGKGFAEQVVKNNIKVESWKKALVDASEISGWEVKKTANGHESKVIKEIVDTISRGLFFSNSHIGEKIVGMTNRVQELESRDKKEWMSAMDRLKNMLRISYDGLKTDEQELFLDIACFFRGRNSSKGHTDDDDAIEILEACYFHLEIGIKVLTQKSLITINEDGKFDMHDLAQDMAHDIVRGEQPNHPENHSRIWNYEAMDMCLGDATKENHKIEAIIPYHDYPNSSQFSKFVSSLKRLRWLHVRFKGSLMRIFVYGPKFLSNELRYMSWKEYPETSFPDSFQAMKLVVLKLDNCYHVELWKDHKSLPLLKVLELRSMMLLLRTPDFDGLPRLQKLTLSRCPSLKEIHPSLGNHTSVEYVRVSDCLWLKKFPTIVHMEKLETLEIENCVDIREFPEIQANMESLVNLTLKHVKIEVLPSSIAKRCTNLTSMYLVDYYLKSVEFNFGAFKNLEELTFAYDHQKWHFSATLNLMFYQFPRSLRKLDLSWSAIEDVKILSGIVELSNLEELDLSENDFSRLDFSLLQLTRLKILNLTSCKSLVELPELPSSLACLIADGCDSLEVIGDSLTNCKWLCQVSNVKGSIINEGSSLLESMIWGNGGIQNGNMVLQIKGVEIAKELIENGFWVGRRSYCRLQLPNKWCDDFSGFLICVVLPEETDIEGPKIHIGGSEYDDHHDNIDIDVSWKEEKGEYWTWMGYVSFASLIHTSWWDQTQTYNTALSFSIENVDINCRGFGVTLVDRESDPIATATTSCQFCHENSGRYTPAFNIEHDSEVALYFTLGMKSY